MRRSRLMAALLAPLAATLLLAPATASAASAAPGLGSVRAGGRSIPVTGYDPASIEQLLLRVQAAQGSTDPAVFSNASPALKAAIFATITRGKPTVTLTEATVDPTATPPPGDPCGWALLTVNYQPGVVSYYRYTLQTFFCWDGSNVNGVPSQAISGSASWGWRFDGTTANFVQGWPAPSQYLSYAKGHMELGFWPFAQNCYPWIQQVVRGSGWVSTSWNTCG